MNTASLAKTGLSSTPKSILKHVECQNQISYMYKSRGESAVKDRKWPMNTALKSEMKVQSLKVADRDLEMMAA